MICAIMIINVCSPIPVYIFLLMWDDTVISYFVNNSVERIFMSTF